MSDIPKLATEDQLKSVADTFTELYNHQGKQIKSIESGIIDTIIPTSPAPTKRGQYVVSAVGVYVNFKDSNNQAISVTEEEFTSGVVYLVFNGTNSRKVVVPIEANGKVESGDVRPINGDTIAKEGYLNFETGVEKINLFNIEIVRSKNFLNPNEVLVDKWFSEPTGNSKASIREWTGRYMSNYIQVEKGKSYIAFGMSTATNRRILGFKNIGDIYAEWFFNAYNSSPTGVFTIPTDLDINYVVVAISTTYPSFLNTAMIAEGIEIIPYEPYFNPVTTNKIKEELLPVYDVDLEDYYNKEEIDDKISSIDSTDTLTIERGVVENSISNANTILETSKMLDQNSKTKLLGSNQTRRIINPLNRDIKNVLLAVYLHSGENIGEENERHFYLNGESNSNFSDVRFSTDGNVLNHSKISQIPYEFVFDSRIKGATCSDFEGNLIYQNEANICYSEDNLNTQRVIVEGKLIGVSKLGDIFYHKNEGDGKVTRITKQSGFTDERIVLDTGFSTSFYPSSFKITDTGEIFAGCYQDPFNAKVWVSSDNGDSFRLTLNEANRQHIHSIVIDRTTTPNTIYVNIDGYISGNANSMMALFKSSDLGTTWTDISCPFPTDYGVIFASNGKSVGGGEGAVKGSPTIHTRNLLTNKIEFKLDNFQNTQKAFSIDNAVLIAGGAHSQCATPILYYSEDMFETHSVIFIDRHFDSKVMNRSYRGGSQEHSIKPKGDEEQCFVVNSYEYIKNPPFRFKKTGCNQALYLVHLPIMPAGGIELNVGNGYVGQGTELSVFTKNHRLLNIPFNNRGKYVFDSDLKGYEKDNTAVFKDVLSSRLGPLTPRKTPLNLRGAIGGNKTTIDEIKVSGKTFSLFYKTGTYSYASIDRLILSGTNLTISRYSESSMTINGIQIPNVFLRNSVREFLHIAIVFNANKIEVYVNGYKTGEVSVDTSSMTITSIGSFIDKKIDQDLIADFNVIDKNLTSIEVLQDYYGGVII